MNVGKIERVEIDLDLLIERRAHQREGANRVEAAWRESERLYNERRQQEMRAEWVAYHLARAEGLERTATSLAEERVMVRNLKVRNGRHVRLITEFFGAGLSVEEINLRIGLGTAKAACVLRNVGLINEKSERRGRG